MQQDNQQVEQIWPGDLQRFDHLQVPNALGNVVQNHRYCSVLYAAFENAKSLAQDLHRIEPNCDLWKKMLFEVSYNWIYHNQRVFRTELTKFRNQLESYVPNKVHQNDLRWMKTYGTIMLDILNQQIKD